MDLEICKTTAVSDVGMWIRHVLVEVE